MSAAAESLQLVHRLPHRTRIRVPRSHRTPEIMRAVRESLLSVPGVQRVEVNTTTGSLLLHHGGGAPAIASMAEPLKSVSGLDLELAPSTQPATPPQRSADSELTRRLAASVGAVNTGVASTVNGWLDLRALVPVTLLSIGMLRILDGRWTPMPTYVFFYYAYSIFMQLNKLPRTEDSS